MKNQTIYGIRTTSINHYFIHTFKVRVTKNAFNEEIIKNSGLSHYTTFSKKGGRVGRKSYRLLIIRARGFHYAKIKVEEGGRFK